MNPFVSVARNGLVSLIALALVACTGYSPAGLAPGTGIAEAERAMGPRSGTHALVDGGTRLEFARGPSGKQTYMLDFDAGGRLVSWEQVLNESNFNQLPLGISREDLLRTLGRPTEVRQVGWQGQRVWSYRYENPFCQWFQVSLDRDGKVVDTGRGPDPACEAYQTDSTP